MRRIRCHRALLRGASHGVRTGQIVSPFQYFQLLGSVAIGWLFFSHLPDAVTWIGATIIVISGLYLGWTQRQAR
jgi:drug/metabolite transporter (DMT)-like permease